MIHPELPMYVLCLMAGVVLLLLSIIRMPSPMQRVPRRALATGFMGAALVILGSVLLARTMHRHDAGVVAYQKPLPTPPCACMWRPASEIINDRWMP